MSKFGERKTEHDGVLYDSALEAATAGLLDTLKRATKDSERVIGWRRQVVFDLFAYHPEKGKEKIGTWTADFVVSFGDDRSEVWECKSKPTKTRDYKRAIKILKANQPGIVIKEITKETLRR